MPIETSHETGSLRSFRLSVFLYDVRMSVQKSMRLKRLNDKLCADDRLPLYEYRIEKGHFSVFGEGNCDAKIMLVGEAPGANEAKTGRPFCGASGKVLDEMLDSVGLDRRKVYITNVVKDRPPENRDPFPREIQAYAPLLRKQIEIIAPRVIVTLGRHSMSHVMHMCGLESDLRPISEIHGRRFVGKIGKNSFNIVTLYHPAVALYNGAMRKVLKRDFKNILTNSNEKKKAKNPKQG